MKRIIMILLITIAITGKGQTAAELLSPKQMTVTWLGVDFSNVKYRVSGTGEKTRLYFKDYAKRINDQVATDHHRYYFPIAFRKDFVYDTKAIDQLNEKIDGASVIVESKKELDHLTSAKIKYIVSKYTFPESMQGVGLVFIYDSMSDKGDNYASFWMAYIDIKTKEVLFLKRVEAEPQGPTFEESYGHTILQGLRKTKSDFNKWSEDPAKANEL